MSHLMKQEHCKIENFLLAGVTPQEMVRNLGRSPPHQPRTPTASDGGRSGPPGEHQLLRLQPEMQQVQSLQSSAVKLSEEMQSLPNRFVQQILSGFCRGQVPKTGSFAVCVQWLQGTEIVLEAEVFLQQTH